MPSEALRALDMRLRDDDELMEAHASVGGTSRGRRFRVVGLNRAAILMLSAHFEGYLEDLADLAKQNPGVVPAFARKFERNPPPAYDTNRDPVGRTRWYEAGLQLADLALSERAVDLPEGPSSFSDFVGSLCREFKWAVEDRGGWRLLWNQNSTARAESAAQQLFHIALLGYCKLNNIDITPEADAGRGPVDFKFSRGWEQRALVEVKLVKHARLKHGVKRQIPTYMTSEAIDCAYLLAIQYTDPDASPARVAAVKTYAEQVGTLTGHRIVPVFVDARPKRSASTV